MDNNLNNDFSNTPVAEENINNAPANEEIPAQIPSEVPKAPRSKLVSVCIALLKAVGYVGIWLAVQTVFVLIFELVVTLANPYMSADEIINYINSFSMELTFITNIITLAIYILIFKLANKSFLSKIKTALPPKKSILPTFGLGISAQFTTLYAMGIILQLLPEKWIESFNQNNEIASNANQVVYFFVAVILAPIFEEIMCRGLILNSLRKAMPKWAAIVLSSLIFGVMHGNAVQIIYATALGVLLGWIYTKTDSILIPMICHFAFNLTSSLLQYVNTENQVISIILSLIMLLSIPVTVLCIIYYYLKTFVKPNKADIAPKPVYISPTTPVSEYNSDALEKIQAEINTENGDNI